MDDPLSALDAHVKRKVFDQVLCKELVGKTRLLVTHAVDFLDRVDRIIVIEKGKITLDGTFEELKNEDYFNTIVKSMNKDKKRDNESKSDSSESEKESDIEKEKNYMSTTGTKIIDEEEHEKINVTIQSYIKYFEYMKKVIIIMIVCVLIMIMQNLLNLKKEHSILSWIKEFSLTNEVDYGGIFNLIMLTLFYIFINIVYDFIGTIQKYIIESRLFREMLEKIMGASIPLFFDKTPSGKIINRFGDDLSTANYISYYIKRCISSIIEIAMILVYVSYYAPTSLFIVPVTIGVFILITRDFMKASKEIKRVSSTVYSPIFTHLSESVDGASTIRTFKKTHQFEDKYCEFQDKVYIVNIVRNEVNSWLSFRLNIISLVFIAYYYVN